MIEGFGSCSLVNTLYVWFPASWAPMVAERLFGWLYRQEGHIFQHLPKSWIDRIFEQKLHLKFLRFLQADDRLRHSVTKTFNRFEIFFQNF